MSLRRAHVFIAGTLLAGSLAVAPAVTAVMPAAPGIAVAAAPHAVSGSFYHG